MNTTTQLTPEEFDMIKEAIQAAIADGRQLEMTKAGMPNDHSQRLFSACSKIAEDPAPVLLQNLGNHVLRCLVTADTAAMRAGSEIRNLMGR